MVQILFSRSFFFFGFCFSGRGLLLNHNSRELAKTHMEVVGFGRVDGQTAVSEDLQDFVEVCEDVAGRESVSLRSNPRKETSPGFIFVFNCSGGTEALTLPRGAVIFTPF